MDCNDAHQSNRPASGALGCAIGPQKRGQRWAVPCCVQVVFAALLLLLTAGSCVQLGLLANVSRLPKVHLLPVHRIDVEFALLCALQLGVHCAMLGVHCGRHVCARLPRAR